MEPSILHRWSSTIFPDRNAQRQHANVLHCCTDPLAPSAADLLGLHRIQSSLCSIQGVGGSHSVALVPLGASRNSCGHSVVYWFCFTGLCIWPESEVLSPPSEVLIKRCTKQLISNRKSLSVCWPFFTWFSTLYSVFMASFTTTVSAFKCEKNI